jgi:hypothetical protein
MSRFTAAVVLIVGFGCSAVVQGGAPRTDSEPPWGGEDGAFKVWLGMTLEPKRLVSMFDEPSGSVEFVRATLVSITPDQEFGIYLLFSGCMAADDGTCDATSIYDIILPDGTTAVSRDLPVWTVQAPQSTRVELSEGVWVTSAEQSDPSGTYRIRATVTDNVAKKTVVLERPLVLRQP